MANADRDERTRDDLNTLLQQARATLAEVRGVLTTDVPGWDVTEAARCLVGERAALRQECATLRKLGQAWSDDRAAFQKLYDELLAISERRSARSERDAARAALLELAEVTERHRAVCLDKCGCLVCLHLRSAARKEDAKP